MTTENNYTELPPASANAHLNPAGDAAFAELEQIESFVVPIWDDLSDLDEAKFGKPVSVYSKENPSQVLGYVPENVYTDFFYGDYYEDVESLKSVESIKYADVTFEAGFADYQAAGVGFLSVPLMNSVWFNQSPEVIPPSSVVVLKLGTDVVLEEDRERMAETVKSSGSKSTLGWVSRWGSFASFAPDNVNPSKWVEQDMVNIHGHYTFIEPTAKSINWLEATTQKRASDWNVPYLGELSATNEFAKNDVIIPYDS